MASREVPRFIAVTRVKADKQAEFESFIGEVINPAVEKVRPQLGSQWQALRPAGARNGEAVYCLLFHGDASLDDWDLGSLFSEAYGPEEGARRDQEFEAFMAGDQDVYEFTGDLNG
jgi:hypothetical protein